MKVLEAQNESLTPKELENRMNKLFLKKVTKRMNEKLYCLKVLDIKNENYIK